MQRGKKKRYRRTASEARLHGVRTMFVQQPAAGRR